MNVQTIAATVRLPAIVHEPRDGSTANFGATWDRATGGEERTPAEVGSGTGDATVAAQTIAAFDLTLSPSDPAAAPVFAEGARQVSIAQGLPGGRHDFTRITPRQMRIVGGAMIADGTTTRAGLAGVLDLAGRDPESATPVNFFAYLHQQAGENEKTPGGMGTAFQQRASIAVMTRAQSAGGVPITYDDNYPTAPRSLTVEEVNTKLKAAIVAFTKEASMTPAQRIRRDALKDMKLTEDELKAMAPAEREVAEKKIGEEVARRLELLGPGKGAGKQAAEERPVASLVAGDIRDRDTTNRD